MDIVGSLLSSARRDLSVADFVPFSTVVAPGIVMTRQGDLLASWQARGVFFECATEDELDSWAQQINAALRTAVPPGKAIYVHRVRKKISDALSVPAYSSFARNFAMKYNEIIGSGILMGTFLFVTLVDINPVVTKEVRNAAQIAYDESKRIGEFIKSCRLLEKSLERFELTRLKEYTVDGVEFSSQLSLYYYFLSGVDQPIRIGRAPLYNVLSNIHLFRGDDIIEIQNINGKRFAQCLEILAYAEATEPGIFDALFVTSRVDPYELIECQSFVPLGRNKAIAYLQVQQKRLASSKDASVTQTKMMSQAIDDVANDRYCIGNYCYTLTVFGGSENETRAYTRDAWQALNDAGYTPVLSTKALAAAYFNMLPGNFKYRPRLAKLTSLNFAHQAPLHNFPRGKRDLNPWSEAVIMLKTVAQQPYYFNFHATPEGKNSVGESVLGHTMVIGQSGSGKTALVNTLMVMSQKYLEASQKLTTIFFDKDFGAAICVRALGGTYLSLKTGEKTGFNPFALPNTAENRDFLLRLLKLLIEKSGRAVSAHDEVVLANAVATVMSFPPEIRSINLIPQNLTDGNTREEKENSLSTSLRRWVKGGDLAWVFDNEVDELNFDTAPIIGIDGTDMLRNPEVKTAISFYLMHRINEIKSDGRRLIVVLDEFWQWLDDPVFTDFARDVLKTGRKNNMVGVFATQSPSDMFNSSISRAIIEQCATLILLSNDRADPEEYIKGLSLKPVEFEYVKNTPATARMFLVKQNQSSVICRLDLAQFADEMNVISGTAVGVNVMSDLRERYGPDPDAWLPEFYAQMRLKKQQAEIAKKQAVENQDRSEQEKGAISNAIKN